MTTIAYKDGIIAADTLLTCGGERAGHISKIEQVTLNGEKYIYAAAGNCPEAEMFREWLLAGSPKEYPFAFDSNTGVQALFINRRTKEVKYFLNSFVELKTIIPFYALGSGSSYAIGAMEHGASAHEAVKCAAVWDIHTGTKVESKKV